MRKNEFLTLLDSVIQEAKICLNEDDIPEARATLNNIIKIAERLNDQAAKQDGDYQDRADQGAEQSTVDASAADRDGG